MLKGTFVKLRAIELSDLEQLRIWRNNPINRQYFREYRELSDQDQMDWYKNIVQAKKEVLMFAIIDIDTEILLGACGLCYIDYIRRSADLSIYIGHNDIYLDSKYSIDCAKLLLDYGFDEIGLHRIWSEVYSHDTVKQNFFDSLGFQIDGRLRQSHWTGGKWEDSIIYSFLSCDKNYFNKC